MALHPGLWELSAPRLVISLRLPVPAVPGSLGSDACPPWLRSCPGKEAEALQGRPPRLLEWGACVLSPHRGFGDGIWVIPEGISLGLIYFN